MKQLWRPQKKTKASVAIRCIAKEKARATDMLQCYECKSWVHYECTDLPNYTLIPRDDFLVSIVLRFQIHFWKR